MRILPTTLATCVIALIAGCANLPNNTTSQVTAYVQPSGPGTTALLIRVDDVYRTASPAIFIHAEPLPCAKPQRVSVASKTEGGSYPSAVISDRLTSITYISINPTNKAICTTTASFVGKSGAKYLVSLTRALDSCGLTLTDISQPERTQAVDTYYPRQPSANPSTAQGICVPETLAQFKQKYPAGSSLPGASNNSVPKDNRALDGFEALLPK